MRKGSNYEKEIVNLGKNSAEARRKKLAENKRYYSVRGPILFLHVNLLDNRSEFSSPLEVSLVKEDDNYVGEVYGAVAIANTIAYVSEVTDPISIFIGLTRRNLMAQATRYLLFGEGETGLAVYTRWFLRAVEFGSAALALSATGKEI